MSISVALFKRLSLKNIKKYPGCLHFWWPIIESRAKRYDSSAGDLLMNPVFRWVFLNSSKELEAFENHIKLLKAALGDKQFRTFHEQLLQDIFNHPIENGAHNRLLSAMTEIKAILRFASEGYAITLIPRQKNQRTPDFGADKESQSCMVEVKYIRPPDKLEEYLLRWWQAQKEVAKVIPQGLLPHLKFDWVPIESRYELENEEMASLKDLFKKALQQPEKFSELKIGRLVVRYIPNRKLQAAIEPLPAKAARSEDARKGLFKKLEKSLESALGQLGNSDKVQQRTLFLAINLSTDIRFLWHERFYERFEALCQNREDRGLTIIVEEVSYI